MNNRVIPALIAFKAKTIVAIKIGGGEMSKIRKPQLLPMSINAPRKSVSPRVAKHCDDINSWFFGSVKYFV